MAANIISVANVAGQNNVVYPSAITMGFPVDGFIISVLPASRVIGATTCVTSITVIATGTVYYTSTTVASLYTSGVYTGSAKFSFTSTIAAVNANALPATLVIGFPSKGVILEPITSRTFGSTACVTKITVLATNTVYFTADTVATLIALT
jgi:hypothetical protein